VFQKRRRDLRADKNNNGFPVIITKPGKITLQALVAGIETVNSPQFLNLATLISLNSYSRKNKRANQLLKLHFLPDCHICWNGRVISGTIFCLDQPCVGVRGQGRPDTVLIEQETSWAPAPVLTFQKTYEFHAFVGIQIPHRPACTLATIPTTLFQLQ
jgi:hypothetical protein